MEIQTMNMKLSIIAFLLAFPGIISPMEQQDAVVADEAAEHAELSVVARELINKVRNNPNLRLRHAIEAHNVEEVRALLQDPTIDVNYRADDNFEEAEEHFKAGNITRGEFFAVHQADESHGRVALSVAIMQFTGRFDEYDDETKQAIETILHLILSQPGVNPNRCDYNGWVPLALTILCNNRREDGEESTMERVFGILMQYHSHAKETGGIPLDLNIEGQGRTPLMVAIENGQERLAQLLLNQPEVTPLLSGKNGGATLLHALAKNREGCLAQRIEAREIFLGLVERGCRVNALMNAPISRVTADGATVLPPLPIDKFIAPLEVAMHEDNIEANSLLTLLFKATLGPRTFYENLANKPDLNFPESSTVMYVKEHTESPDKQCYTYMTAAARGYTQALKEMMRKNPELILANYHGWTALDFAMYNGQGDVVRLLLSQSAINPDERRMRPWMAADDRGITPCRLAKMGEAAREKDREEWAIFKDAEAALSENSECSQEPNSNPALEVFGQFNHARAIAFMAMRQYIKETLRKEVPREIVRAIAHKYRFPMPLEKATAAEQRETIINNNNNNNNVNNDASAQPAANKCSDTDPN